MHTVPFDTVSLPKRKQGKRSAVWTAIGRMQIVRRYVPGTAIMLLFGLAECFTLPSPFMMCLLFAMLHKNGKASEGSMAGCVLLAFLRLIWGQEISIVSAVLFIIAALFLQRKIDKTQTMYVLLLIASGMEMMEGGLLGKEADWYFRKCCSVLMGFSVMPAFIRSVEVIKTPGDSAAEDDAICICIPAMIGLCGAAHIGLFSVNFGVVLGSVMVMTAGWLGGAFLGAGMGIGAGFAIISAGGHVMHLLFLPMAGLLCGCFREKRRIITMAVYVFSALALTMVTMHQLPRFVLINQGVAAAFFMMIPKEKMKKLRDKGYRLFGMQPGDNPYIRMRMQQWVRQIERLAKVLPVAEISMNSQEEEGEDVAEQLCRQCDRLPICWHDEYEKTKRGLQAVLAGDEVQLPVINEHFDTCLRLAQIPGILEGIYAQRKDIRNRNRASAYERSITETHLLSLSQAAQLISLEGLLSDDEEGEYTQRARLALERMHFSGSVAFVKKVDGHWIVAIRSDTLAIQPNAAQRIARQISLYFSTVMEVTEQTASRIILEEAPLFELITGQATISAAVHDKVEIGANGDAMLVRKLSGGRMLFSLSDGMGHGIRARNESKRTLEMLAVCLQAGYTTEQTMKVVNGAMLSATGGESFATLDMGVVDLWTGEVEMNKMGACNSFIIQSSRIHRLASEALPLGILEHVLPAEKNMTLEENDRILLMTDGVSDIFENEDDVVRILQHCLPETPQTMAETILQEALDRQQNMPMDDMTVLCVQLALHRPRKQNRKSIPA